MEFICHRIIVSRIIHLEISDLLADTIFLNDVEEALRDVNSAMSTFEFREADKGTTYITRGDIRHTSVRQCRGKIDFPTESSKDRAINGFAIETGEILR